MKHDKRRYLRTLSTLEVWLGQEGIFTRNGERIRILGAGGAFIQTRQPYPLESMMAVRFRLKENEEFITCHTTVRSVEEGRGVGVEFTDLTRDERARIKAFVEAQLIAETMRKSAYLRKAQQAA
ncbi:MAG TPA: PilZ domain-containing protein [Blastocatellia bacterium]|nr:PilZ domain-containing protein [Blastocatellia bacterium]